MKKHLKENRLLHLIRDYLTDYLPNKKFCSPHTIEAYRTVLNLFLDYICDSYGVELYQLTFDKITSDSLSQFLSWLETERNCSPATRNHRLACIRAFYKYAGIMDVSLAAYRQDMMKVPLKKQAQFKTVKFLSEAALRMVLQQPNPSKPKELRDIFYMVLMYDSGCRNQEILDLRLGDVHVSEKSPYIVVTGKGNKTRVVPIMTKTVQHFEKYIQIFHNEMKSDSYLFYTRSKGLRQQMSPDNVARFMQRYGRLAAITGADIPDKLHPHMLRHTRAMHLYRGGMPLALLSEWLGHSNIETTMIYAYADTEMKRQAISKATTPTNPLKSTDTVPEIRATDTQLLKTLYGLR
jgi:site-specific recombinase XerD